MERISLVLALPPTYVEFRQRYASACGWDYGQTLGLTLSNVDIVFEEKYRSHLGAIAELVDYAMANRVSILRCATLDSLAMALAESDVIILVAHWRGSRIHVRDLAPAWRERFTELRRSTTGVLGRFVRASDMATAPDCTERDVVRTLNIAIENNALVDALPLPLRSGCHAHSQVLQALNRDVIDEEFGGEIARGNQLELYDGLHPPAEIGRIFPPNFSGTLDLSCCTSSVLSDYLRLTFGDRMHVLASKEQLPPDLQTLLVEATLRIVQARPEMTYAQARVACIDALWELSEMNGKQTEGAHEYSGHSQ